MRIKKRVLVIENTDESMRIFRETFEIGKKENIPENYDFELIESTTFPEQGASKDENRRGIIDLIKTKNYDVIIFDLLLRNIAEKNSDIRGYLSLEVANKMKEMFDKKKVFVVFSSEPVSTDRFEKYRRNFPEIIQDNWSFIKKPRFYHWIPRDLPSCREECDNTGRFERDPQCNRVTCFLFRLADLYKKFDNSSIEVL